MPAQQSVFTTDEVALSWANDRFSVQQQQLVADHPWSKVFKLQGKSGSAYLKLVPDHEKNVVDKETVIHKYFDDVTPQIKASNKKLGAMVIQEHLSIPLGNYSSEPQMLQLLSTYADIQSKTPQHKEPHQKIPKLNIKQQFDDLLDFLNPEHKQETGVGPTISWTTLVKHLGIFLH